MDQIDNRFKKPEWCLSHVLQYRRKFYAKWKKRGGSVDMGHEVVEQGKSVDTDVFLIIRWILVYALVWLCLHQIVWCTLVIILKKVGQAKYLISLFFTCCKFHPHTKGFAGWGLSLPCDMSYGFGKVTLLPPSFQPNEKVFTPPLLGTLKV